MPFKGKVHTLVNELLQSYDELGGINHFDGINLPSKTSIISIMADLETLIFPGFRETLDLECDTLSYGTAELVFGTAKKLIKEIDKSVLYKQRRDELESNPKASVQEAEEAAFSLLKALPQFRKVLREDVEAIFDGDPAAKSFDEIILAYPGMEAILVHRLAHHLYHLGIPLIPRMMSEHIHSRTGIDIHPGATIGRRFFIDHGTGVVVGETCVIGDNVKIYQGVTLGALSVKKEEASKKRHPTIENNVTIYAGATILGGETTIGHHSTLGGNVWVTHSVPAYSMILNKPQEHQVLQRDLKVIDYQI